MRIRLMFALAALLLVQKEAFSQGQLYQQAVGNNIRVDSPTQSLGGYIVNPGYSQNLYLYPNVYPPSNGPLQPGVSKGWYYPVPLDNVGVVGPYAVLTFYKPCTVNYYSATSLLGSVHYGSPGQPTVAGVNVPTGLTAVVALVYFDDNSQGCRVTINTQP